MYYTYQVDHKQDFIDLLKLLGLILAFIVGLLLLVAIIRAPAMCLQHRRKKALIATQIESSFDWSKGSPVWISWSQTNASTSEKDKDYTMRVWCQGQAARLVLPASGTPQLFPHTITQYDDEAQWKLATQSTALLTWSDWICLGWNAQGWAGVQSASEAAIRRWDDAALRDWNAWIEDSLLEFVQEKCEPGWQLLREFSQSVVNGGSIWRRG